MCKVDCLGTGLCPGGLEHGFASCWPQGRMDIVRALAGPGLPFTAGLARSADSCTLCGVCDLQCHFTTGLRPLAAMQALKEHVAGERAAGRAPLPAPVDPFVVELAAALSPERVTNDPADLAAYADDPGPFSAPITPRAVALPATVAEAQAVIRLCARHGVAWVARGNGSSVIGFVLSPGVVIDTSLLKTLEVDAPRWRARVGAGVAAFELQAAAHARGMRANVAEPAALVLANIACSGIFSTFSHAYGFAADNFVSATFVGPDGELFSSNDRGAPNVFGYAPVDAAPHGLCVEAEVRLHPIAPDEGGLLVPFPSLGEALRFARELGVRRVGLAVAVLGGEYLSVFAAPTAALAARAREALSRSLGIAHAVLVVGDRLALAAVRSLATAVIDQSLFRTIVLGLPRLAEGRARELLEAYQGDRPLYELLCRPEMARLVETVLAPSPAALADAVEPDLREWYARLYARPELTDLVWLNSFRVVSSRMGREKHVFANIVYAPLDPPRIIEELSADLAAIGDRHGLRHDFGFVTPLELGTRAVFEYDYYFDHTSPAEADAMRRAAQEIGGLVAARERGTTGVRWFRWTPHQGFARSAAILFG
jgi:hypothetical protein